MDAEHRIPACGKTRGFAGAASWDASECLILSKRTKRWAGDLKMLNFKT
jgi:hypothetical protein